MPSLYNGIPLGLLSSLPSAHNIASSTNASPIVITTADPHGLFTGDQVQVINHATNTAANGRFTVNVLSATQAQLVGSHGIGVGGATGTLRAMALGSRITIPADGDRPRAATFAPGYEGLADRTALLYGLAFFTPYLYAGGLATWERYSVINSNALINIGSVGGGIALYGEQDVKSGGTLNIESGGAFVAENGSTFTVATPALFEGSSVEFSAITPVEIDGTLAINGAVDIASTGSLACEAGAPATFHDTANFNAAVNVNSGSTLKVKSGGTFIVDASSTGNQIWEPINMNAKGRISLREAQLTDQPGSGDAVNTYGGDDTDVVAIRHLGHASEIHVHLDDDTSTSRPGDTILVTRLPYLTGTVHETAINIYNGVGGGDLLIEMIGNSIQSVMCRFTIDSVWTMDFTTPMI